MSLRDLGERGYIDKVIREHRSVWIWGPLKPGDDASAVPYIGGYLILKIDGFSSHNSRYPWNSWRDFGWKGVTACTSDIVAKGGRPFAYLVSLGLESSMSEDEGLDVMRGVAEAINFYGGYLAGGDTNSSSKDVWLDVACVGFSSVDPIPRGGEPGDKIVITGKYGLHALAYYYHKLFVSGQISIRDIPKEIIEVTSRPIARVEINRVLERYRRCIKGSVDVSDSLAESLYLISEASGYIVKLDDLPLDERAVELSKIHGLDPIKQALNGGEEFELVLAVDSSCADEIIKSISSLRIPVGIYGTVSEDRGLGVYYRGTFIERIGFRHF
ncbi:MAG: thiamine-phosphate kinase [Sulfolobales archaeon]